MGGNFARGVAAFACVLVGSVAVAQPGFAPVRAVQAQDPPAVLPRVNPPPKDPLTPALPPAPSPVTTLTQPVLAEAQPPLPGSLEDNYQKELDARRRFQAGEFEGTVLTFLPNSLLWEPPLAVKREPRMQALISGLKNLDNNYTVDTQIGMAMGVLRADFTGADCSAQLDIFGVVSTRHSPDTLTAEDYRFGFPVTVRWGWWQAKAAYEHTSAHLGDEFIGLTGARIGPFTKDEVVVGLGRFVNPDLRVYGHAAYAFTFGVLDRPNSTSNKLRYDIGFEWYDHRPTGLAGTPYAAANVEWRGDQDYDANYTLQVGWLWRNPSLRLASIRVFAEYYNGRTPYGQFLPNRESFVAAGFGFDF